MACQCNCCKGACCYDSGGTPTCSSETCADCEDLNGDWQGPGTECTGTDDCPCDPPADHTACDKCVDGTPTVRCDEGENCCDGVCESEPCPCVTPDDCPVATPGYGCCDGDCKEHIYLEGAPGPNQFDSCEMGEFGPTSCPCPEGYVWVPFNNYCQCEPNPLP